MKKRLALIMATAMIASALSGTVAFASEADDTAAAAEETKDDAAGGDTMTMDEVKAAVQKSDVPSDLKLGYVCMEPWQTHGLYRWLKVSKLHVKKWDWKNH